jgi:hypothetical protein
MTESIEAVNEMEQLETMCATVPPPDQDTLARARARVFNLASESAAIPASKITVLPTRPRARRRLVAAAAGCAAVGLAVAALTLASGSRENSARPAPAHAQLAAWTVQTNRDGTVAFTLNNTSHPAQLERALAKAGVPAIVRWGKICEAGGPGQPLIGGEASFMTNGSGMDAGTGAFFATLGGQGTNPDLGWSWTLIPSKIPHGGHFVISAMPGPVPANDFQAVWEFAKISAPITCATHVGK